MKHIFMRSEGKQTTSTFINENGQRIFYRRWTGDLPAKGIVVIVHGLNSHSGYYQDFASQLVENMYAVYALDLAGRGHSEGERFYTADYEDVIGDIDSLIDIAVAAHPGMPVFLYGHSAGGVFASVYAVYHQSRLTGLIAASFAFRVPAPGFALMAMKLLGYILPHTRLIKLKNEDFSRDSAFVSAMNRDPLIVNEKQPARTMQQLLLASEHLQQKMPELGLPLLILHGTADRATMPEGSQYFAEHAAAHDKQLKLYEGYYHDLLNDKYNGIIVKDILRWLRERTL